MTTQDDRIAVSRAYAMGRFGQLHYRRAGPAGATSPLLLLHPSPYSGVVFESLLAELGRDRTVVAPDTPGYGMSDAPSTPPEIADYAGEILDLIATLGLGLVDVMGYHTGSLIALDMARLQPAVVRKVIMVGASMFTPEEKESLRARFMTPTVADWAAGTSDAWQKFRTTQWRMDTDESRVLNVFLEGRRNATTAGWGLRAVLNYDVAASLTAVHQPVLVLNPEDTLWRQTPRVIPFLRNGHIHDLPGWCYGFLDEKTAEVASLVRNFLDAPV